MKPCQDFSPKGGMRPISGRSPNQRGTYRAKSTISINPSQKLGSATPNVEPTAVP